MGKKLQVITFIKISSLLSDHAQSNCFIWKAPLQRVKTLNNLRGLISLGQGVDHILKENIISDNITVVRIVDPFMAKAMSHWVILSVLNFIRDTFGYHDQQRTKTYKPRKEINFTNIKIAVYGIGAIGVL